MGSVRVLFSTGRPKRGKFADKCSNRVVPNSYFYKICLGPVVRKFMCLRFWARKQSIQCRRSFCLWKQANTGVHPLLLKEARRICLFDQQTKWFTVTSKINRDWLVHISWLLSSRCNGRLACLKLLQSLHLKVKSGRCSIWAPGQIRQRKHQQCAEDVFSRLLEPA